jgi:HK97 family phage portal protein
MSLFFKRSWGGLKAADYIPDRASSASRVPVTTDTALRSSAVWACLRLRADLISTMPLDSFRRVDGVQVETAKPPVLVNPGGEKVHVTEWLYSSQFELDRCGNAFGLISARDGSGNPARIDLVPATDVTVRGNGPDIAEYRIGQRVYDPREVWHERQFTVPGLHLGLSPVAFAAWSIGGYLSAQQFALDWFTNDANPTGQLRNTQQPIPDQAVAETMKARFKAAVRGRDIFVTGSDWEFVPGQADAQQSAFIEQMKFGVADICRFFGVPGDMIDAEGSSSSITYANVTQRNLQLLVMNLGPAIVRREAALSNLLPRPRYVKFNTDAVLRMDPQARTEAILARVAGRVLAPSEARELDNLPPFTAEQVAEFDRLWPKAAPAPMVAKAADPIVVEARTTVEPGAVVVNVDAATTVEPTHVDARSTVDARTTVEPAIDATSHFADGAFVNNVDARTTVEPASVELTIPPPPASRKRIETDDNGRITAVVEERDE